MTTRARKPNVDSSGVPFCSGEDCPQYDGKRCYELGRRPDGICEPAVIDIVRERNAFSYDSLAQKGDALTAKHDRLVAAVIELRDRERANFRCPFVKACGECPTCRLERVANIALGVD